MVIFNYNCTMRGFSQSVFCVNGGGHSIVILPEVLLSKYINTNKKVVVIDLSVLAEDGSQR